MRLYKIIILERNIEQITDLVDTIRFAVSYNLGSSAKEEDENSRTAFEKCEKELFGMEIRQS